MEWIYLSPHFDDVALSCGALVWEQATAGHTVNIWTVCAGDQPPGPLSPFAKKLHQRWETGGDAVYLRRREDIQSCAQMGAAYRHFSIPDCIYRGSSEPFYNSEEALFGHIHPGEASLIHYLSEEILRLIPLQAELVCPLAVGGHVDHQLTRATAETLGRRLWYYADVPYILDHMNELVILEREGWLFKRFPVSEAGFHAWEAAVAAHGSQISTFWKDAEEMRAAIEAYSVSQGGVRLWQPPFVTHTFSQ